MKIASIKLLLFSLCFFSVNVQNPANCSNEVHMALCRTGDSTGDNSSSVRKMPMFIPISSWLWLPEIIQIISPAVLIPAHSGFPSNVDTFSKCGYCFEMVHVWICPALWLCQLAIQILEYLIHYCFFHAAFGYLTAVLSYCAIVLPYGCNWTEYFSKVMKWMRTWDPEGDKNTMRQWGGENQKDRGKKEMQNFCHLLLRSSSCPYHCTRRKCDCTFLQENVRSA